LLSGVPAAASVTALSTIMTTGTTDVAERTEQPVKMAASVCHGIAASASAPDEFPELDDNELTDRAVDAELAGDLAAAQRLMAVLEERRIRASGEAGLEEVAMQMSPEAVACLVGPGGRTARRIASQSCSKRGSTCAPSREEAVEGRLSISG